MARGEEWARAARKIIVVNDALALVVIVIVAGMLLARERKIKQFE